MRNLNNRSTDTIIAEMSQAIKADDNGKFVQLINELVDNTRQELTAEQADGMCYGDAVKISDAPNWALYSEKNAEWIERYNEEIYQ